MKWSRANDIIVQKLNILISKSTPYSLSSPYFGNPTIHDFVKDLILSTNIIDVIDEEIPNGYRADWGQVIDSKSGNLLSKESDIIIYTGKPFKKIKNKCIRYVLVDKKNVRLVIQVRSSIQSVKSDDKEYCRELKQFSPKVWFVAECCLAKKKSTVQNINKKLKEAGYDQFYYFYRKDYDSLETKEIAYGSFSKFIDLIKRIK